MESQKALNVTQYIETFSDTTQAQLKILRSTILNAAPNAKEIISYGMPAYKLNKVLVYFAAYKNHIGFYPTAIGIETFKTELSAYKWSKGAVQFPILEALPCDLITRIVQFKVAQDAKI